MVVEAPREDRIAAASIITADRTPRAAESIPQLLSELPGVAITRLGGMGSTSTISLRGSTSNQVLVYVDGVPVNTVTGGGVDLGAIPLGDVDRIEVYRGTSPIGFGASGIGGVVSVTTVVPKTDQLAFDAGGGSFATYYGDGRAAWNHGRWHLYAGLHGLTSAGDFHYLDNQNTNLTTANDAWVVRRDNDLRQVDSTAKAVVDLSTGRQLTLTLSLFGREQGLPGVGSVANPQARLATSRSAGVLAYQSDRDLGACSRFRGTGFANYGLTHLSDRSHQINASPTDARDGILTVGATADCRRIIGTWLELSGVLDARYDRFRPTDALGSMPSGAPATRFFGAAGAEADAWMESIKLDVLASIRVEAALEQTSGRDYFGNFLATSGDITHVLPIARLSLAESVAPWLSLRANAGRYARLPSTTELYGNTGYLVGNPSLRPESGFNADAGAVLSWARRASRITWSTFAFASRVSDLIQFQLANGRARADNLESARILGVESNATVEFATHARLVASATYTDARDTSPVEAQNGRQLPLRPRYRCYIRPEWRHISVGASTSLGFYADLDATAGNFAEPANLVPVEHRWLISAGAYADLPAGFSVRLSARNLADARIHDLAGYPLPGRELYAALTWASAQNQDKEQHP